MSAFSSTYPRLSVYVGAEKVQFVNGVYATENKEIAEYLRKLVPYVEEVIEEKAEKEVEEVVEKPAPKKASARRSTKKTPAAE